jgi:rod shape-determining protein MreD
VNPLKVAVVVLVALVLQVGLLAEFSFDGARPDALLLVAVCAGFVAGPEKGAAVGFAAGLAFDVVLTTPFGLSALVYTVVGYAVGSLSGGMVRSVWWVGPIVAALASAAGVVLYAVVGEVLGQATLRGPDLTAIVVIVSVVNAVLAPLAVRALRWARTDDVDHRRHPYFAR